MTKSFTSLTAGLGGNSQTPRSNRILPTGPSLSRRTPRGCLLLQVKECGQSRFYMYAADRESHNQTVKLLQLLSSFYFN